MYNVFSMYWGCDELTVYICKCLFSFESKGEAERCPDCGGMNVRHATEKETAEHLENKAKYADKK